MVEVIVDVLMQAIFKFLDAEELVGVEELRFQPGKIVWMTVQAPGCWGRVKLAHPFRDGAADQRLAMNSDADGGRIAFLVGSLCAQSLQQINSVERLHNHAPSNKAPFLGFKGRQCLCAANPLAGFGRQCGNRHRFCFMGGRKSVADEDAVNPHISQYAAIVLHGRPGWALWLQRASIHG